MNSRPQSLPKVGVGIIVLKNKTQVLMHRRKGSHGGGYWGTGGGHLELGESLLKGALREFHEEAGRSIVISQPKFLAVSNFTELYPKHYVDVSFVADWISGEADESGQNEVELWQWFPLNNLPEPIFPIVERYLKALKSNQLFFDSEYQPNT
jgi:8-oxo-dGTP diphosphatase